MLESLETENLIDVDRLRELVLEGTGEGVRVAVLDTGIDVSHPALEGCVENSYEVVREGAALVCRPVTGEDVVGHGTACAGIIHELAPKAVLCSVRVVGSSATGTGEQFLYGLHWVLEQGGIDIINLSIGTLQHRFQAALHQLADRAYYEGVLIIAAGHNRRVVSYPSHFASLVGVESGVFENPLAYVYRLKNPVEVQAHGVYVRAPSPGGGYQLWTGTSFACPHVTALAARLISRLPNLTPFEFKTFLRALRENR